MYDPQKDLGGLLPAGKISSMTLVEEGTYGVTLDEADITELRDLLPRSADIDRQTDRFDVLVRGTPAPGENRDRSGMDSD